MKTKAYYCQHCSKIVPADAEVCPHCGQPFSSVLCPNCGKQGSPKMFINGCPFCGYLSEKQNIEVKDWEKPDLRKEDEQSPAESKNERPMPQWFYTGGIVILSFILLILIFWLVF